MSHINDLFDEETYFAEKVEAGWILGKKRTHSRIHLGSSGTADWFDYQQYLKSCLTIENYPDTVYFNHAGNKVEPLNASNESNGSTFVGDPMLSSFAHLGESTDSKKAFDLLKLMVRRPHELARIHDSRQGELFAIQLVVAAWYAGQLSCGGGQYEIIANTTNITSLSDIIEHNWNDSQGDNYVCLAPDQLGGVFLKGLTQLLAVELAADSSNANRVVVQQVRVECEQRDAGSASPTVMMTLYIDCTNHLPADWRRDIQASSKGAHYFTSALVETARVFGPGIEPFEIAVDRQNDIGTRAGDYPFVIARVASDSKTVFRWRMTRQIKRPLTNTT